MIDLDQDGLDDIVFCEAQDNEVRWIRQTALGSFAPEELLAGDLRGPVHVEGADMDADGDIDLVVSSMTIVFPHNDRIGFAFLLENDGTETSPPTLSSKTRHESSTCVTLSGMVMLVRLLQERNA